jgi:hypothetical protein
MAFSAKNMSMGGMMTNSDRNDFGNILAKRPKDVEFTKAMNMAFDKVLGSRNTASISDPSAAI